MEPRDRPQDPIEDDCVEGWLVARSLPGDELRTEVGHEERSAVTVGRHAEARSDEAFGQPSRADTEDRPRPRLPQVRVVRRPDDPVTGGRRPLEDETLVATIDQLELGPRPAVVDERLTLPARETIVSKEVGELAPIPWPAVREFPCQHLAGSSPSGSGSGSMYTTCESGQLRVSTTTSGSVADAFSSTWISPAGM